MDHRIPKVGVAISILLAIGATITFFFLNNRFEGPADPTSLVTNPYELTARFDNAKTLPSKQAVLHKGVAVGRVNSVDYDDETQEAIVTFTLNDAIGTVYSDAVLQIGERSLLGDAYLNLLSPGTEQAGALEAGDEVAKTIPSVNFDEALDFLDEEGRSRVRSLVDTFAEGTSRDGNGFRLNGTVGGLTRTTTELRRLTDSLRGQEEQLGTLVADSAVVLGELGDRERALRTITVSGRATLDALAVNTDSIQQAVEELPRLLASGQTTLAEARPLLEEARPLLSDLRAIAPDLVPAFDEGAPFAIGPVSSDLVDVIEGLTPQRKVAAKVIPQVTELNRISLPLVQGTGPAAANSVTVADYLAPRINSIGAFYALGASVTANEDAVGRYSRFGIVGDAGLGSDNPQDGQCALGSGEPTVPGPGFCYNAYPEPSDALDNQPFGGTYPRLEAFEPPDPKSLRGGN